MPDTFGLPEYFISEVVTEVVGANVRLVCGIKRGGQNHWLYSAVMPADQLIVACRQIIATAQDAFNAGEMDGGGYACH